MTKMAVMEIYTKTFTISRTRSPTILKLHMKHLEMKPYKMYINHDPRMTLTYFMARSTQIPQCIFIGKIGEMSYNHSKPTGNGQMDKIIMLMKQKWSSELFVPALRLYTCK